MQHDGFSPPKRQKTSSYHRASGHQADDTGDLDLRAAGECAMDGLSLGETMLRLDPTPRPTARAKTMNIYQGGGENNVIYDVNLNLNLR